MIVTNTRIKKLRKALDLTQQEFADKIGSKRNTVATYEMGRSAPSAAVATLICKTFNVNETWLRTGEGEMFNAPPETLADKLAQEYGLDDLGRQIMEAYLELNEGDRLAVGRLIQGILDKRADERAAAADQPDQHVPPGYSSRAELEAEADEFAAMAREQFLSEKIPGYQAFSASESDGDLLA